MAGYPYDLSKSFIRDPKNFPHDAFGHDGADGCGRGMPHSGTDVSPKTKTYAERIQTPVLAPIGGRIVETGFDPEAGRYHLIAGDDGAAWGLGHHSSFIRTSGRVERGDRIALMGDSGGTKGVHVHIWRATTMEAARRIVTGYINLRRGRTVAAWAASMGLTDPYPHIIKGVENEQRRLAALVEKARAEAEAAKATAAQREEDELMSAIDEIKKIIQDEARLIESRIRREVRPEVYYISKGADGRAYTVDDSPAAALIHPASGFIMPLNPPDESGKRGQIESLRANYRIIGFDSVPQGFHEGPFYNTIKDVARGAGIIDRKTSHAEGNAWARALFSSPKA